MIFIIIISFTLLKLWPSQETLLIVHVLDQRERNIMVWTSKFHRDVMTLTQFQGHCQQKLQAECLVKYEQDWIMGEKICSRNGFQKKSALTLTSDLEFKVTAHPLLKCTMWIKHELIWTKEENFWSGQLFNTQVCYDLNHSLHTLDKGREQLHDVKWTERSMDLQTDHLKQSCVPESKYHQHICFNVQCT